MPGPVPALYRLSRALVRAGVRTFYRGVVAHTLEHVPPRGPVIFAATHPNSVTDPLVLGACLPRPVHYVAHSGLFRRPLLGWLLPRAGVIPVYRPEDFPGPVDNAAAFRACIDVLAGGGAIGIFPEGTSHQEERVRRLRTGTARIALAAEAEHDFGLGVQIVPVGLNFAAPGRFRTDVLVLIGPPLFVPPWRSAWLADPVTAVRDLTADLQRRLEALALEVPTPELLPVVRAVLRLLRRPGRSGDPALAGHHAAREVGEALAWAARERPLSYVAFARDLDAFTRERRRLRVPDLALAGPASEPAPQAPDLAAPVLPLALVGAATHAVPYRLTALVTRGLRPHPTKEATVKFCAGLVLFGLWYAAAAALAWRTWGAWGAAGVVVGLATTGWLAARRVPGWGRTWRQAAGALAEWRHRGAIERLRQRRSALAEQAAELCAAYREARPAW